MTSDLPDENASTEEELPSSDDASIETSAGQSGEVLEERTVANDLTDVPGDDVDLTEDFHDADESGDIDDAAPVTGVSTTATPAGGNRAKVIIGVLVAALVVAGVAIFMTTRSDSSSTDNQDASATVPAKTKSLDGVKVEGAFGEKPTITFKPAYVGSEESFKVLSEGDGPVVEDGQRVTLNYLAVSGADGSELDSTYGQAPQAITASKNSLTEVLANALVGQHVGTRVLVAGDQTQAQPAAWVLFVFDIVGAETIPTSANGTEQAPQAGFPTVTVENGVPKFATPTGNAPTELKTEVLIKGNGPVVASGQTVTMQYTGIIWATGKEFDSSWGGDPVDFPIGSGQVIPGFDEGLIGQTVGSRVVLVIPPDKGYGAEGNSQAGISGTDTLVFVVDILAAS
jgi:peptidylprolyl isomerase